MNVAMLCLALMVAILGGSVLVMGDRLEALNARILRAEAAAEFCGCPKVD